MITQGIDAGTGETEGLDAAGTKARSAQADAPKSLNSPSTTQGEALEARARELLAAEQERRGFHDRAAELRAMTANDGLWSISLAAITAALQPNIDHAVGGADLSTAFEAWWGTSPRRSRRVIGYSDKKCLALDAFSAGSALSAPQQPVNQDAVREAMAKIIDPDAFSDMFVNAYKKRQARALAKADKIAALATPPLDNTGLDAATVLLEALQPFSDACTISNADDDSNIDDTLAACKITWADLRRARAAIARYRKEERR